MRNGELLRLQWRILEGPRPPRGRPGIPACPLALDARRKLDERRQLALFRYYAAAGAGGLAVGVHTTQFAIHDPKDRPVAAGAGIGRGGNGRAGAGMVRIAGICGATHQAIGRQDSPASSGYHAGLLSLGALKAASERGTAGPLP